MQDSLLVNPFNAASEAAPVHGRYTATRITPTCSACHSDDIVSQAVIQWSNEAQDWQIADTFGQAVYCNACRSECKIAWTTIG